MSATLKMIVRFGCFRLQTYALVILKLMPNFLASHVCVMPRFFKCSLMRLQCSLLCAIMLLYVLFLHKDMNLY